MRPVVYLHGFASSPASTKATYLGERLVARGVPFLCPDLNAPDFASLTITRVLDVVDRTLAVLPAGPVALVGSSLGGFAAIHATARRARSSAAERHPVDRLVLLAPAVDLAPSLEAHFGPATMAGWETTGRLEVHHHAEGRPMDLGWTFMADARRYDAFAVSLDDTPTLVFQGLRDETVKPDVVQAWAYGRRNVTLRLLDDTHQLGGSLELIWEETWRFLGEERGGRSSEEARKPGS